MLNKLCYVMLCYMLGGNMGSLLYGDVSVMNTKHGTVHSLSKVEQ